MRVESMTDLISRQAIKELFKKKCVGECGCCSNCNDDDECGLLDELPPVEPKREQGKWIRQSWGYECNKCHEFIDGGWDSETDSMKPFAKFCPHCGADMRGES